MLTFLKKPRLSVTLVEAVTVVAIFAVIAATTGSILFTSSRTGARLADKARVFQELTWAADYMINEARWGANFTVAPAPFGNFDLIRFQSDIDRDGAEYSDPCVWYWRGFTTIVTPITSYGNTDTIYRGLDTNCIADNKTSLDAANASRQELSRFLVDNPVDNASNTVWIFDYNNTTHEFITVLTAQEPKTQNKQTLKSRGVSLNDQF